MAELNVSRRIGDARLSESLAAQLAGVAATACGAVGRGIVTTGSHRVIHSEFRAFRDDLCFRHVDEWRMNGESLPFDSGLGREIRQLLEGRDEFRTAIWITAVVESIYPYEDVARINYLGESECEREKDGIARRNVSDRNPCGHLIGRPIFRNGAVAGESRATKLPQVTEDHCVLRSESLRQTLSGLEFDAMSLPIIEAQRVNLESFDFRKSKYSRGVQSATQQHHRFSCC